MKLTSASLPNAPKVLKCCILEEYVAVKLIQTISAIPVSLYDNKYKSVGLQIIAGMVFDERGGKA